jgi:hypothetical protein
MECDKDNWCTVCPACFNHCGCLDDIEPDPDRPCRPSGGAVMPNGEIHWHWPDIDPKIIEAVVAAIAAAILTSEDPEDTEGQP